jgi:hypothetical protein
MGKDSVPIFILTRFAQLYREEVAPPPSDEWLEKRLSLLQRYTLPALERQSDRDFIWLLLVSETLDKKWQERIAAAVSSMGKIVLQEGFVEEGDAFAPALQGHADSLITVRLDSDDLIHPDFIKEVRAANLHVAEVLSFITGAVYEPATSRAAVYKNQGNPFVALHDTPQRNVFQLGGHSKLRSDSTKSARAVHTRHPMWVQVVHGGNLLNWFKSYARPVTSRYIGKMYQDPTLIQTRSLSKQLRDWVIYLRNSFDRVIGRYFRRVRRMLSH